MSSLVVEFDSSCRKKAPSLHGRNILCTSLLQGRYSSDSLCVYFLGVDCASKMHTANTIRMHNTGTSAEHGAPRAHH